MEELNEIRREVVEVYRQPGPREVVETYSRPLPWLTGKPPEKPVKKRKSRKGLWIFLASFTAVTLLAVGAWALWGRTAQTDAFEQYYEGRTENTQSTEITIPTAPTDQNAKLVVSREQGETMTAQEIYKKVNPSVVTVMVRLDNSMSVGTGVIFTEDGYILTNYHVVEGGEECVIALDTGRTYTARYVAGDDGNDLAIVKIDETGLPAAEFGDSDLLSVGDKVYAIGNPLGVELRGTLTDGIVSAINRDVWVDDRTMTLIQTNAALNSGNSGGPLINECGQVVGINVIKMTSQYSNVEGLGFSIPTSSMRRIVNDLLTYGELQPEPLLGITVLTPAVQLTDDLWGLKVQEVTAGLAGDLAGIQPGDYVISAAGESMYSSQDLLRVRQECHLGDLLPMTLWRDGETIEVTLELNDAVEEEEDTAPWYAK